MPSLFRMTTTISGLIQLARWNHQSGWILLWIPCLWGGILVEHVDIVTRTPQQPFILAPWTISLIVLAIISMVGSILARSVGCIWNDIVDRKIDASVQRTKHRPLPKGQVHVVTAIVFATLLFVIVWLWSWWTFPHRIFWLLAIAIPLALIYPFIKRTRLWPQIWLGFTFSSGIWIGWLTNGDLGIWPLRFEQPQTILTPLLLWLSCSAWVVFYDTLYAMQDRHDDRRGGLSSLAIAGASSRWPILLTGGAFILLLTLAMLTAQLTDELWLLILPGLHLIWQIKLFDPQDTQRCFRLFRSNTLTGMLVTCVLIVAVLRYHNIV